MKNLIIFGFCIMALVFVQFAQAQTVDEVINKHIAALGGKENLAKIKSVIMEGSFDYQGVEVAMTMTQVQNKLSRQDITAMGQHGFDMTTDKDGWNFMPFFGMQKPEAKNAEEVKQSQHDLDIAGPLVDYAAKGHKVELLGKEDADGTLCYKIKISLAGGREMYAYIDTTAHMLVRTKEKRPVNGKEAEVQIDYADYKMVEGIKIAHSLKQQFGTVYISTVKVNTAVPESAFKHDI